MRFGKTIKKAIALGTGLTMLSGAMAAADLSQYPAPFIADGKFTGVMVVGDKAAAEDVIGVSDIAISLQFSATTAAGATTSSTNVEGEAWKVQKGSTNVLEMTENLESGSTNREAIATITSSSYIDDVELQTLLRAGTVSNSKGDSPYEQRLYFEDATTGFVQLLEDREDVTGDFLYFQNGKQIARYELEFTSSLESDVDDSTGSATTTGDYLTDMDDTNIEMMGKTYTIVQARRNSGLGGNVTLTLMGGAVKDTLLEGETKTYTVDGKDFETTLDFVSSTQTKFTINGEATRLLKDGDTDKLSDDTTVGVSEILYQDYAGGIHSTTFFLGAQKLYIKDTDITDTASSHELKVGDETIDGANAWVEGSDDDSTFKIDKINVNMTADDDYYIPAGGKLSENPEMDEPDLLFTAGWDIEYQGVSDEETEEINIKAKGSDEYELEFTDGSGNKATIPLAYTSGTTVLKFGDNDDDLLVYENKTITKDDYFIITDETDTNGERKSYALRYRGSDKISADNPVIKFDDLGSGDRIERTLSAPSSQLATVIGSNGQLMSEIGQIKLGGGIFRVYNVSSAAAKDFDVLVDMDADSTITSDHITLNTKFGAWVNITNSSTDDGAASPLDVQVKVDTPNSDDYDDKAPNSLWYNITASSGEVRLAHMTDQLHSYRTPEDDDKNTYAYTTYGAYAKRSIPTNDPNEISIAYPRNQRLPQVFITGEGAALTTTSATSGEAVVVNRIEVGATKLASEVPDITAVNAILVGGPCANAAAAEIMGNPADCAAGFEAGKGLIKLFENDGNVAMLVAGYSASDTRAAAKVISNHGDYALEGTAREVTTATMAVTEVTEVVEEEEEAVAEEEEEVAEE